VPFSDSHLINDVVSCLCKLIRLFDRFSSRPSLFASPPPPRLQECAQRPSLPRTRAEIRAARCVDQTGVERWAQVSNGFIHPLGRSVRYFFLRFNRLFAHQSKNRFARPLCYCTFPSGTRLLFSAHLLRRAPQVRHLLRTDTKSISASNLRFSFRTLLSYFVPVSPPSTFYVGSVRIICTYAAFSYVAKAPSRHQAGRFACFCSMVIFMKPTRIFPGPHFCSDPLMPLKSLSPSGARSAAAPHLRAQ